MTRDRKGDLTIISNNLCESMGVVNSKIVPPISAFISQKLTVSDTGAVYNFPDKSAFTGTFNPSVSEIARSLWHLLKGLDTSLINLEDFSQYLTITTTDPLMVTLSLANNAVVLEKSTYLDTFTQMKPASIYYTSEMYARVIALDSTAVALLASEQSKADDPDYTKFNVSSLKILLENIRFLASNLENQSNLTEILGFLHELRNLDKSLSYLHKMVLTY